VGISKYAYFSNLVLLVISPSSPSSPFNPSSPSSLSSPSSPSSPSSTSSPATFFGLLVLDGQFLVFPVFPVSCQHLILINILATFLATVQFTQDLDDAVLIKASSSPSLPGPLTDHT
jgi:hypothetical protein